VKHLLPIVLLILLGYGAWHLVPKAERDEGVRLISRHAIRLGALLLIVLALLAGAYYVSSTQIL
jgi:hypothetical protein